MNWKFINLKFIIEDLKEIYILNNQLVIYFNLNRFKLINKYLPKLLSLITVYI